ncbi:MAG: dynamin family protein [Deltaproteobacteria bacterium]|nr:dynamin family protein [Deltaproteobacteria bacterium]
MVSPENEIRHRLKGLEEHLKQENPLLVEAIKRFRQLDAIACSMGLMEKDRTYTSQIAWWPLISVLGTYSAGKSTFINHYLQESLQSTGPQAVDDKFSVICYTADKNPQVLPGIAVNADPRFPFYEMSNELEKVQPGEGTRIDSYLQLKTCNSDHLRGLIFIDSPLKITDYIIDLSDLALIFFDARHPEPGAMRDTLKHLVANTIQRSDSSKFLYILNMIDTSAREDTLEEVVAAWQRTIAQEGLTAGRFYFIYNPDAAIPIQDDNVRKRFETRRDRDLTEIHNRIRQVGLERAYRIVGTLVKTARELQDRKGPRIIEMMQRWRRGVLLRDLILFGALIGGIIGLGFWMGLFSAEGATQSRQLGMPAFVIGILALVCLHFLSRKWARRDMVKFITRFASDASERESFIRAFLKNTRPWRSVFASAPIGWGRRTREEVKEIILDANRSVQTLNDQFARPSGGPAASTEEAAPLPPFQEPSINQ